MRAGAYEHKIQILKHIVNRTDSGAQEEYWKPDVYTRAAIDYHTGARTDENHEVFYEYTITFIVHRYVNVEDFDRIMHNGKQYRILSVVDDRHSNQKTIETELVNE